jgi:hypothetical protein
VVVDGDGLLERWHWYTMASSLFIHPPDPQNEVVPYLLDFLVTIFLHCVITSIRLCVACVKANFIANLWVTIYPLYPVYGLN